MQTKTVTLDVTKAHIMNGLPKEAAKCPIALALKEFSATNIFVESDQVSCYFDGESFHASMSESAKAFVENFDDSKPVEPFTFSLKFVQRDCDCNECMTEDDD